MTKLLHSGDEFIDEMKQVAQSIVDDMDGRDVCCECGALYLLKVLAGSVVLNYRGAEDVDSMCQLAVSAAAEGVDLGLNDRARARKAADEDADEAADEAADEDADEAADEAADEDADEDADEAADEAVAIE